MSRIGIIGAANAAQRFLGWFVITLQLTLKTKTPVNDALGVRFGDVIPCPLTWHPVNSRFVELESPNRFGHGTANYSRLQTGASSQRELSNMRSCARRRRTGRSPLSPAALVSVRPCFFTILP